MTQKRDLTVTDSSLAEVKLTLWGDKVLSNADWESGPIVLFKGVKVGDFGGRSLSVLNSSSIMINPNIPEAFGLHQWRTQFTNGLPATESISNVVPTGTTERSDGFEKRVPISYIKENDLGAGEKGDYVSVCGFVGRIAYNGEKEMWYTACPACNKKVIENMGSWACEKCNKTFEQPTRRYITSMVLLDYSGGSWVSLFNDEATKLLGMTADALHEVKVSNENEFSRVCEAAYFKPYNCRIRVKQELVGEEMRAKSTIMKLEEINYVQQNKSLLAAIAKYN